MAKKISIRTGTIFFQCQEKAIFYSVPMEAVFSEITWAGSLAVSFSIAFISQTSQHGSVP